MVKHPCFRRLEHHILRFVIDACRLQHLRDSYQSHLLASSHDGHMPRRKRGRAFQYIRGVVPAEGLNGQVNTGHGLAAP